MNTGRRGSSSPSSRNCASGQFSPCRKQYGCTCANLSTLIASLHQSVQPMGDQHAAIGWGDPRCTARTNYQRRPCRGKGREQNGSLGPIRNGLALALSVFCPSATFPLTYGLTVDARLAGAQVTRTNRFSVGATRELRECITSGCGLGSLAHSANSLL